MGQQPHSPRRPNYIFDVSEIRLSTSTPSDSTVHEMHDHFLRFWGAMATALAQSCSDWACFISPTFHPTCQNYRAQLVLCCADERRDGSQTLCPHIHLYSFTSKLEKDKCSSLSNYYPYQKMKLRPKLVCILLFDLFLPNNDLSWTNQPTLVRCSCD